MECIKKSSNIVPRNYQTALLFYSCASTAAPKSDLGPYGCASTNKNFINLYLKSWHNNLKIQNILHNQVAARLEDFLMVPSQLPAQLHMKCIFTASLLCLV